MANQKSEVIAPSSDLNIGISAEKRAAVAQRLGLLLADQHALYMKLRNYHWNVTGMFFQPLHELFQEQYEKLEEQIDDIAERIRSLGFFAPGSMEEFARMTRLEETGHLDGNAHKMIANLLRDNEAVIQTLRHDVSLMADEYQDVGTEDFLTGLMEEHEKMAWMLRAHLSDAQ